MFDFNELGMAPLARLELATHGLGILKIGISCNREKAVFLG
jgi:hypothetical protein